MQTEPRSFIIFPMGRRPVASERDIVVVASAIACPLHFSVATARAFVHESCTSSVFFIPLADTSIPDDESENAINIFVEMPGDALRGEEKRETEGEKEGIWKKKRKKKNKSRIARTINEKSLYKRARDV